MEPDPPEDPEAEQDRNEPLPVRSPLREKIWQIIFGYETPAGRGYDVALFLLIIVSVTAMMLETVTEIRERHGSLLRTLEWIFILLFAADYFVRMWCVRRRAEYIFSFFGLIDLLAWLPALAGLLLGGTPAAGMVRILRVLRIFTVLKMVRHMGEAELIVKALLASRAKVTVFLFAVVSIAMIMGTIMYLVEGDTNVQFSSIPKAVYWAIVTVTTVGYGDIAPTTPFGQFMAAGMMILGYAIIAVPTGIISFEISRESSRRERHFIERLTCPNPKCGIEDHRQTANFCYGCGTMLREE